MAYSSKRGNRPFEQAGRANHSTIINNPVVQSFVENCRLPDAPEDSDLNDLLNEIPRGDHGISAVIAIDGGMTESYIREQFPSASIAFLNIGPLFFNMTDLRYLDQEQFIGPEDMAKLKNLQRYQLVMPTKTIMLKGRRSFSEGVRASIYSFMEENGGNLLKTLAWLLFREWLPEDQRQTWEIPKCPSSFCDVRAIAFKSGEAFERQCPKCNEHVFLTDALRLYERIDDEQGAAGILSYLLTAVESILIVDIIRNILSIKRDLLKEVLFIKDGPLAFFGTTAPLHRPMRELMIYLRDLGKDTPLITDRLREICSRARKPASAASYPLTTLASSWRARVLSFSLPLNKLITFAA